MLAFKESECVLHSGHGGIGRRYAGCAGVSIKHRVLRSRACRLVLARQSNCEMYFEFEQARIKLSAASSLTIKGLSNEPSRVELVNEDGQHMWLWGVDPQKLPVIVQAFQRMQMEATRQTQPHAKPFLQPQVPDISKEEWQGLTRIVAELAAENAKLTENVSLLLRQAEDYCPDCAPAILAAPALWAESAPENLRLPTTRSSVRANGPRLGEIEDDRWLVYEAEGDEAMKAHRSGGSEVAPIQPASKNWLDTFAGTNREGSEDDDSESESCSEKRTAGIDWSFRLARALTESGEQLRSSFKSLSNLQPPRSTSLERWT